MVEDYTSDSEISELSKMYFSISLQSGKYLQKDS